MPPRWDDPSLRQGAMVRAALWLSQVVGEGSVFTKTQLREAFPTVAQVDRRVRDLRKYNWVIATNLNDASLSADEQRFVQMGVEVWDSSKRRAADSKSEQISNKERSRLLAEAGYQCSRCGIAGGEPYAESPSETAVLSVSKRPIWGLDDTSTRLVVVCTKCRLGDTKPELPVYQVQDLISALSESDRQRLARWASKGLRGTTPLDRAWGALVRLPKHDWADAFETPHYDS